MVSLRHSSNIRAALNEKFKEWSKGYMPHARGWGEGGGVGGGGEGWRLET